MPGLGESAALFRRQGERSREALALISLAIALLVRASPTRRAANEVLDASLDLFREAGDTLGRGDVARHQRARALLTQDVH